MAHSNPGLRILLVGDIVGRGGREAAMKLIPSLREEFSCDFCVVNGENMAGGAGITEPTARTLHEHGGDVVTSGDHIWDQRDLIPVIDRIPYLLRPANFAAEQPGRGHGTFTSSSGHTIGVVNLIGRIYMAKTSNCPFAAADALVNDLAKTCDVIIVDFHAEATSEKIAMGRYLDGRATVVFGTHTHVQTADEQIFEGGTAYITDLGMVGSRRSVLGRDVEAVVTNFRTGLPKRFKVADNEIMLHGAVVQTDAQGRALSITRVQRTFEP